MPKILKIITHPNPFLRKISKNIGTKTISDPKFQKLCENMMLTMKEKDGVGLAAPQIGKSVRVIVVNTKDEIICAINPQITKKSITREWDEEGCLSVPETFGKVKRYRNITCTYFNREGAKIEIKAKGFLARIFQHEIDHLDGILFIDKARNIKDVRNL